MSRQRRLRRSGWLLLFVAAIAVTTFASASTRVVLASPASAGVTGPHALFDEEPTASEEPSEEPSPSEETTEEPSTEPTAPTDDANGDGIADALQPDPIPAGSFIDSSTSPVTSGSIVSTAGISVTIADAAYPEGVRIQTGTGTPGTQAVLDLCGGYTVLVDVNTSIFVTCGSVTIRVGTGSADVVVGAGLVVVSFTAGGQATVAATGHAGFTISVAGASAPIGLTVDGVGTELPPGTNTTASAWDFVGFAQPIDAAPIVNSVKAGQAVPMKWRLLAGDGTPIVDLQTATIAFESVHCQSGAIVDVVEQTVANPSGLLNLGKGNYQLNWKSPKGLAGACGTLRLTIGDGVAHDALFRFTK